MSDFLLNLACIASVSVGLGSKERPRNGTGCVKLYYYGIRGQMLKWIEAFLSDRTQNVSVSGIPSLSRPVVSGDPQGSVLGPVLLLLFIQGMTFLLLFSQTCACLQTTVFYTER